MTLGPAALQQLGDKAFMEGVHVYYLPDTNPHHPHPIPTPPLPLHQACSCTQPSFLLPLPSSSAPLAGSLQIDQMFAAFPPDVTGNLDYKNLVHIITHGEEKD